MRSCVYMCECVCVCACVCVCVCVCEQQKYRLMMAVQPLYCTCINVTSGHNQYGEQLMKQAQFSKAA